MADYEKCKAKWVLITPQMASDMIMHNSNNARNVQMRKVDDYSRDLVDGSWGFCDQPIAFFDDGTLANGQHRLLAIIKSGVSMLALVMYDVPLGTRFDLHLPRSMAVQTGLSVNMVGCIRAMYGAGNSARMTPAEVDAAYGLYGEALDFVYPLRCHRKGLSSAAVGAVVTRAFYHTNKDSIRRFMCLISDGVGTVGEQAVIRLRNWLLANNTGVSAGATRISIYKRT